MTKQVQRRRGTTSQHTSFTGAEGEISVNTTNKTIHVHDGSTAGGFESALHNLDNVSAADVSSALAGADDVDIDGGTIDGTVIGGNSAAAITGTAITGTSFSTSGDFTFGDNDKAIFGAGSDLQIYHDGTQSFISDQGTGSMFLRSGGNIYIQNAGGTANYFKGTDGGASELFHTGAAKLATTSSGIDVTGTVTADGLTVDGDTLIGSIYTNNYKLGVVTPSASSTIQKAAQFSDYLTTDLNIMLDNGEVGLFAGNSNGISIGNNNATDRLKIASNGDISFYEDTGTTPKFFWDASAQRLNIDGDEDASSLATSVTGSVLELNGNTSGSAAAWFGSVSGGGQYVQSANSSGTSSYDFLINPYGGNVGIGEDSPAQELHVSSTGEADIRLQGSSSANHVDFFHNASDFGLWGTGTQALKLATAGSEAMRIDSSGNVGIGTDSPAHKLHLNGAAENVHLMLSNSTTGSTNNDGLHLITETGTGNAYIIQRENADLITYTNNQEAMRIDSSGNLLVGKTATNFNNVGSEFRADGAIIGTRDGGGVLTLNRKTSDGVIASFYKGGSTVGSIGTIAGDLTIGDDDVGIRFDTGTGLVPWDLGANSTGGASTDGAIDIGVSSARFKDLHLSGGVYLGGNGSANKLDDYEEGTWTPTVAGTTVAGTATYTGYRHGYYTKVGNLVTANLIVGVTAHTGSGFLTVTGLPFVASSSASNFNGVSLGEYTVGVPAGRILTATVAPGHAKVSFQSISNTAASSSVAGLPLDSSFTYIIATASYRTDS